MNGKTKEDPRGPGEEVKAYVLEKDIWCAACWTATKSGKGPDDDLADSKIVTALFQQDVDDHEDTFICDRCGKRIK